MATNNKRAAPDDAARRMDEDGLTGSKRQATEDDVEGHGSSVKRAAPDDAARRMDEDGLTGSKRQATEDDVEGHSSSKHKSAPDGATTTRRAAVDEDDVEGHSSSKHKSAPDGATTTRRAAVDEDDVEGHMIGAMNPIMARDLARAKDQDIQRAVSRGNLVSEAKRANRPKA